MCDIEPLLYNTESPVKGVMWQRLLTCNMPAMLYAMLYDYYDMSSKQQEKLCKSGFISRLCCHWEAGGRHCQAAPYICSWFAAVARQARQWCSGHSRVASCLAAANIRLWLDGQPSQLIWDCCTACIVGEITCFETALCTVGEITWFETRLLACANNQSQASLLLSQLINDHTKTCNKIVDSSTKSIKNTSCNSLDNTIIVAENKFTAQHEGNKSLHSSLCTQVFALCHNHSEFITTAGWIFTTAGGMICFGIFHCWQVESLVLIYFSCLSFNFRFMH